MYIPPHFQETDGQLLRTVMGDHDFATLVTPKMDPTDIPMVTHLPLLLCGEDRLVGHVARTNPHWRLFEDTRQSLAIFQGPHGYVSPRWYVSDGQVPTWNYVTVHATGRVSPVRDETRCLEIMQDLVATYETGDDGWRMDNLPERTLSGLVHGIVIFEMRIERLDGKFKLSQNRKPKDQDGVIRHLGNSTNATDRDLAAWMSAVQKEPTD